MFDVATFFFKSAFEDILFCPHSGISPESASSAASPVSAVVDPNQSDRTQHNVDEDGNGQSGKGQDFINGMEQNLKASSVDKVVKRDELSAKKEDKEAKRLSIIKRTSFYPKIKKAKTVSKDQEDKKETKEEKQLTE